MMRGSNSLGGPVVRSGGPAYQQISEVLTHEIFRQTWKVGEPLPNEKKALGPLPGLYWNHTPSD